jgi:hypothetical protein
MRNFKTLIAIVAATQLLNAVDSDKMFNMQQQQQQQQYDQNGNPIQAITPAYPTETIQDNLRFTSPQILKDRFELNINDNFAKGVVDKKDRYSKILTETLDLNLLIDASVKQLKNTDVIYIHPHFITTITLPEGTEIVYVKSSSDMDTFNFSNNLLFLQPSKDFVNGNMLITFRDNKNTYYTNVIIQKYSQQVYKDGAFNKYVIDDNYLSLNYRYVWNIKYSPIEVIKKYFQLNGDKIVSAFKRDGDYDVILLNGTTFYITRDSAFGQVDYKDVRFNVSQGYSYGDRSLKNQKVNSLDGFYPSTEYIGTNKEKG